MVRKSVQLSVIESDHYMVALIQQDLLVVFIEPVHFAL